MAGFSERHRRRVARIKGWLFVALIVAVILVWFITPLHTLEHMSQFMSWTGAHRVLGSVLFVLAYTAATAFFLPMTPFSVAGGYVFGTAMGAGLGIFGATAGATIAFLISRWLGRDAAELWLGKHAKLVHIDNAAAKQGFLVILIMRLLPFLPYNGINVAAGLSRIRPSDYIAATAVGLLPDILLLSYVGYTSRAPTSPRFFVAVGVAVGIAIIAFICHRIAEKKGWLKKLHGP
jgi:uncharacterized membrane protein YdjX (TVP38/TMEM64 family)